MKKKNSARPGTLRRVLGYIGHTKGVLVLSLFFSLLVVVCTLGIPYCIGLAIDAVSGASPDRDNVLFYLGLALGLTVLGTLSHFALDFVGKRAVYSVLHRIRGDAMAKINRLPLSYLDSHRTGDIMSRITSDADHFADGLLLGFTQFATGVFTILGTVVFMFTIHPKIALFVIVATPLSLFAARFIANRTYRFSRARAEAQGNATAYTEEMLSSLKTVIAFSAQAQSAARFAEKNEKLHDTSLKAVFFSSLVNPVTRFVNALVYAGVCFFGAYAILQGGFFAMPGFSVGLLSTLLNYASQYTKPFNEISGVAAELQSSLACAERIFELLDAPEVSPDGEMTPENVQGKVAIHGLSFSYDKDKRLIEDMDLSVPAGHRIAIVGPTGCGKTTLINLLMRFYEPDKGSITLDGTDLRAISRSSLRAQYGMVLQDTWLSGGTVRENIAMGRPNATMEEIVDAAKRSHAHSFIARLPKQYDTVLGENGGGLSAGQKQLLCIARIMLCMPPMLILDEATSNIDTRTELKISDAFETLMKGKTSFIVAHRLSTIKNADLILVMKDGNIVEMGDHDTLLQSGGFYHTLWNSQFEGA
ncbi:MAG: ABC transporter ATP-binding protein [Ruminococcaceae bacterium]|nr:ABC transporter ATP-binding protein [Oscillospiraceae bacterium]